MHGAEKGDYTRRSSVPACVGGMGDWRTDPGLSLTRSQEVIKGQRVPGWLFQDRL